MNIDTVIRSIRAVRATSEAIDKLERDGQKVRVRADKSRAHVTFADWYDERPRKPGWLLMAYEGWVDASRALRTVAKKDRPEGGPEDWLNCARGEVAEEDYLLTIHTTRQLATKAKWMFVHRIVKVSRTDPAYERGFSYQAGQVYPVRACPPPPFLIDERFRRALRAAPRMLGPTLTERFLNGRGRPAAGLLRVLRELY